MVYECTSSSFDGMIAMMSPDDSWVAKWQRTKNFKPGCYAISVNGRLPASIIRDLKASSVVYRSRDTSQKSSTQHLKIIGFRISQILHELSTDLPITRSCYYLLSVGITVTNSHLKIDIHPRTLMPSHVALLASIWARLCEKIFFRLEGCPCVYYMPAVFVRGPNSQEIHDSCTSTDTRIHTWVCTACTRFQGATGHCSGCFTFYCGVKVLLAKAVIALKCAEKLFRSFPSVICNFIS